MPQSPLPVILSIPHSGRDVPIEVQNHLAIDDVAIYNECDLWAENLYDFSHPDLEKVQPSADGWRTLATISTPIARCLIDANRPPEMLDKPDGPVKTRTSYGATIYKAPIPEEVKR